MKKLFALLMLTGFIALGNTDYSYAQETEGTEQVEANDQSFHQRVKEKFIEGGWVFMGIVLLWP